ncbi:MAG: zinc-binding dehydrogenase [Anaerolineae bacterium]|nr:zinc-binding dehydrogenase [Anaerolineae bacterium]
MKYKTILVTQRGGLDGDKIADNALRPPMAGEACIRVLATPVCQDDIAIRIGNRPFLKKPPYVPGYSFVGVVEAIGEGVTSVKVGDRVAGLTQYDSHAEFIHWDANKLVPVPETLDPAEVVTLILNYLVAYQILHRVAKVKSGDKVLLIGSSGGVGTAFLQLGMLAGLKMYGLASPNKNHILNEYGAIPIDYHTQDFVEVLHQLEPDGINYVFNGMDEEYFKPGLAVLKRGGMLVSYGAPQSFIGFLRFLGRYIIYNLLPNGKSIDGYGTHRLGVDLFKEDWTALFKLMEDKKIKPIIAGKYPLLEAIKAYKLLESGQVTGNLVLLAPELSGQENG